MRGCLHLLLGGTFWHAGDSHHGQGDPVHFCLHEPGIKHVLTTAYHPQSNGMKWLSACTGRSSMPCVHVERGLRGTLIFHGFCWA